MKVQIERIGADQVAALVQNLAISFGMEGGPDELRRFQSITEVERLRGVFDHDQLVATLGTYSLQLTVPGGQLPMAGTTLVTVLPTHRRRGICRQLVESHLREVHERGESLAGLWASEGAIYGRFGYGPATFRYSLTVQRPREVLPPYVPRGTMRMVDVATATELFPAVFDAVRELRPGMHSRSADWWNSRVLADPEHQRYGATAQRHVVYWRDEQAVGYASYRTRRQNRNEPLSVQLEELIAVDADAERALWQLILEIDLAQDIRAANVPIDAPLFWWLKDVRRAIRSPHDSLWLRTIDVPAALEARKYAESGELAFRVSDVLCPWNDGVFSLRIDDTGSANCGPSQRPPLFELPVQALGIVYLGGTRLEELARAGLVIGNAEAIARAGRMFAWHRLPWCQEVF